MGGWPSRTAADRGPGRGRVPRNNKGEARRTISRAAPYVNNRRVQSVNARLGSAHLAGASVTVLRTGKKKYALLRFV